MLIDGEKKSVSLDDLRSGYMMHEDYTRKTQRLSEERNQLNKMVEDKAMELYLAAAEGKDKDGKDGETSQKGPESEYEKRIEKLEKALESQNQNMIQRSHEEAFNKAQNQLSEKYAFLKDDENWRKVLYHFSQNADDHSDRMVELEKSAKVIEKQSKDYKQSIIDEYLKEKSNSKSRIGEVGASGSAFGKSNVAPKDFKEARERAEERLAAMG